MSWHECWRRTSAGSSWLRNCGRRTRSLGRRTPGCGRSWHGLIEPAGLKHRPDGAIRVVPIPPVLVSMLCHHLGDHGTTPDGRLFRGARGGMLSESVYGRVWRAARRAALGPGLAATALARRPYDLRHAALSLWLNASGAPAEVAARGGNSARVLHKVYLHCTEGQDDTVSQRIEGALDAGTAITHSSPRTKASGYTNRRCHPRPCPLSVRVPSPRSRAQPTAARVRQPRNTACTRPPSPVFPQLRPHLMRSEPRPGDGRSGPRIAHRPKQAVRVTLPLYAKPVTQSSVTGFDLRKRVAGVGFEPT